MLEKSLLNRSLQKLRVLVSELQRSNQTLQSENRKNKQAVASLQEANDRLQRKEKEMRRVTHKMEILLANSHQGYILVDRAKTVVSFNPMSDEVTFLLQGKRLREKASLYDYVPAEKQEAMDELLSDVFNGRAVHHNRKMPDAVGERWFRVRYDPVAGDNGEVEYALISYIELTQEMKLREELEEKERAALAAQKQLAENEANLKAIIDHSSGFIYSLDRDYRYITFNGPLAYQVKAVFGVDLKRSTNALELLPDEPSKAEYREYYDRALLGERVDFQKVFMIGEQAVHMDYYLTPIQTDDGVIGVSCFVYDVTEKIKSARRVEESETRYRSLIEHSEDMITMLDVNGGMIYRSPSVLRVLGYNDNELKNATAFDLMHPDDLAYARDCFEEALARPGVPVRAVVRTQKKNGSFIDAEGTLTNLLHVDGVNALVTNFRDVTERVYAERTYREIFDKASDGIFVHDIETGAVLDVNMKSLAMTGYTREELLSGQQPLLCTDDPDYSMEKIREQIRKAVHEGPQVFEWKGLDKDRNVHWAEVSLTRANIAGTDRLLAYFRDINGRKLVEQQLQKTFERLQDAAKRQVDILNALPANIALLDKNGVIVSVNKAWRSFAAANDAPDDGAYIGVNYFDVCIETESTDTDGALVANGLRRIMAGSLKTFSHEYACHSASEQRWFRVEIAPLNDNPQDGLVVMHINITDRKRNEEELRASNELYDLVSKATNDAIWDWNLMLNKTQWSAGYEKLFGYKLADAGNSDISQLRVHPDDRDRVVASIEEKLRAGESTFWECEYRYLRADGSVACVHDRGYVVHDESGQPVRIVGVMQDITQRKMAEAAQAEWQKRLAAIFTGTSDAILLANDAGHYIQVNPAASHMLGYSEEELLLLSVSDVIARVVSTEKDTSQWDTFRKAGHQSGVIELRCKDGSTISCHFNATANVLPGIHLSILTDITERISQEKRIRKSEALLQASQQLAHIGSWELCIDAETQTETLTWSDETFRIFGYEPHSITVNPELFYRHVRKDERAAVEANVAHAIANKTQMEFEHRIVRVDGVERVMLERADIHYGEDGKVRTVVGTVKDITERKHADTERERLTQELIDKNKGLEQFAYIVSHNLRSPVANIVGLSNILMRGDLQTLKRREMMESLNGAVDKLDNVIRDLNTVLQVKGTTFEKHEPVNLRTMLNDIVVSLDNAVTKENALVEMNLETDTVVTIRTYMYSVMQNLITNSLKYRRPDAQPLIQINSKTSCDKIIITYTDNGLGMNLEKVGDKVFGMYKRFHSHVEGKGMGLFMVKTQVETLGGKISISSKPNEGTQFTITLPQ